jgi:hypothetical protein
VEVLTWTGRIPGAVLLVAVRPDTQTTAEPRRWIATVAAARADGRATRLGTTRPLRPARPLTVRYNTNGIHIRYERIINGIHVSYDQPISYVYKI